MRKILVFLLIIGVFRFVAEPAFGQNEPQHPDSETRLRTQMDTNYSNPMPEGPEGILGEVFPNIHGNDALHFDYVYTNGVFNNARGGAQTSHSTRYVGIFDLSITADTEKLGLWKNGTFYTHALFSHGKNPSGFVGDWQGVAVFAYETPAQVSEYWYEHKLLDGAVVVRTGKMDAGVDFFYLNSAENFLNASGTCVPTTGIPTAPANAWGAMTNIELSDALCFKFGFFDADTNANKFWMSETGNVYTAYQFDYHYRLFRYLPGFAYIGGLVQRFGKHGILCPDAFRQERIQYRVRANDLPPQHSKR